MDVRIAILGQGRIVTATIEPPLPPVERAELARLLAAARRLLGEVKVVRGAAYRVPLCARIDAALAREPRS